MNKLLKNRKGMSLIEMIIALAILAVVAVPLSVSFMNAMMVSKLVERQTKLNEATRLVKEQVTEALIQISYPLPRFNPADPANPSVSLRDFITNAKGTPNDIHTSDNLAIKDSSGGTSGEFFYTVSYRHNSCYDGANFPFTYHVIISIRTIDNSGAVKILNTFKIAVNAGTTL